jgi:hypothetical protein
VHDAGRAARAPQEILERAGGSPEAGDRMKTRRIAQRPVGDEAQGDRRTGGQKSIPRRARIPRS